MLLIVENKIKREHQVFVSEYLISEKKPLTFPWYSIISKHNFGVILNIFLYKNLPQPTLLA